MAPISSLLSAFTSIVKSPFAIAVIFFVISESGAITLDTSKLINKIKSTTATTPTMIRIVTTCVTFA